MKAINNKDDFDPELTGLKNALENADAEVPAGSWERLQLKRAKLAHKKKIRIIIFIFSSVFLSLLIVLTFLFRNQIEKDQNMQNLYVEREIPTLHQKTQPPIINAREANTTGTKRIVKNDDYPATVNNHYQSNIQNNDVAEIKKNAGENTPVKYFTSNHNDSFQTSPVQPNDVKEQDTAVQKGSPNKVDAKVKNGNKKGNAENSPADITSKNNDTVAKPVLKDVVKPAVVIADQNSLKTKGDDIPNNEIHLGFHYTYNSRWIMNQNTYGQFNGKELAYVPSYGSDYGIMVGYDVQRKYGFQSGIIFNSFQGEKYHDIFINLGEFHREVKLCYMHIPVLYKIKRYLNNAPFPVILNFIGGLQYGKLKSATETINSTVTDIKDHFHKSEIGLVLNIESDVYLNNYLYFTFGINSSLSNNINGKNWPVKDSYGKSHNFLMGANIGLNYYIKTK